MLNSSCISQSRKSGNDTQLLEHSQREKKKDLPTAQICKIDYLGSVLYGKNTSHQIQFTEIQTFVK